MTFEEFQALCNQAISTNLPVQQPTPIVIGTGEDRAYLGDTPDHHLIVFKETTSVAVLQSIYASVRFRFDAVNNQTIIEPLTHATS